MNIKASQMHQKKYLGQIIDSKNKMIPKDTHNKSGLFAKFHARTRISLLTRKSRSSYVSSIIGKTVLKDKNLNIFLVIKGREGTKYDQLIVLLFKNSKNSQKRKETIINNKALVLSREKREKPFRRNTKPSIITTYDHQTKG